MDCGICGWLALLPRHPQLKAQVIKEWRSLTEQFAPGVFKPYAQSLYIDLVDNPNGAATPIHLGYRLGRNRLIELLQHLRVIGVNHVGLNLKYGERPAAEVLEEVGQEVLPYEPILQERSPYGGAQTHPESVVHCVSFP